MDIQLRVIVWYLGIPFGLGLSRFQCGIFVCKGFRKKFMLGTIRISLLHYNRHSGVSVALITTSSWRVNAHNVLLFTCRIVINHTWSTMNIVMPPVINFYATMLYMGMPWDYKFYIVVSVMLQSFCISMQI